MNKEGWTIQKEWFGTTITIQLEEKYERQGREQYTTHDLDLALKAMEFVTMPEGFSELGKGDLRVRWKIEPTTNHKSHPTEKQMDQATRKLQRLLSEQMTQIDLQGQQLEAAREMVEGEATSNEG